MFQATSGLPIMEVGQETLHRDNARRSWEDSHVNQVPYLEASDVSSPEKTTHRDRNRALLQRQPDKAMDVSDRPRASQLKTPAWSGALHAARRIPRAARATVQRSPPSKRVQTRELVVLVASTAVGAFRVRLRD